MSTAQAIRDWLAEHPDSSASEVAASCEEVADTTDAGKHLHAMTKAGSVIRSGEPGSYRYRVAAAKASPPDIPTLVSSMPKPNGARRMPANNAPTADPERVIAVLIAAGKVTLRDVQLAAGLVAELAS